MINQLASELNEVIKKESPSSFSLLSCLGKELYFPKGIVDQTSQAKLKANRFNATIGIAKQDGHAMYLPSLVSHIEGLGSDESVAYPPTEGVIQLRNSWQKHQFELNPAMRGKQVSLPVVTGGITHGLNLVAELFCDPGDPVLLPDMLWGNYRMIFGLRRGAEIISYPFFNKSGSLNLEAMKSALASLPPEKKAILILNYPHNPTGYTPTEEEGRGILEIIEREAESGRNILVVSDDSYFGFFYEDNTLQESLFGRLCDLHSRVLAIKLDGATKENYAWGLRIGFLTIGTKGVEEDSGLYAAFNKKIGGAIRSSVSCCSMLSQSLLLKSIDSPTYNQEKVEKYDILKRRYSKVKEVLGRDEYARAWQPYPFNSGYFMCLSLTRGDAEEVRLRLLENYGVGIISLGQKDIRVAFSCIEEQQVQELFDLLYNAVMEEV
jgi:aspartate/methionine/tyrosine aminotransferase